jgi:hypothetical protein
MTVNDIIVKIMNCPQSKAGKESELKGKLRPVTREPRRFAEKKQ